ncbi:MAG TPA: HAD-IIB family hydrolase [Chryseolinea sp.]|nr:HAD-IIB family hydrolase [Chryseolinea sp.]
MNEALNILLYAISCDCNRLRGTLAWHEKVSSQTIDALRQVKETGRKLVLVTGRELADLERVFPEYKVFDYIVAENGALIHFVETGVEELLGQRPSENFITELKNRGVHPLSVGRVIVATREPHEKTVLDVIKQSGIELQMIFNKGAVMILPSGINKATGLQALLKMRHLSIHNTIAIGDAENDSAMLEIAEYSVAVNNALPALKERADFVTIADAGDGVRELLLKVVEDEHAEVSDRLARHYLHLGTMEDQQDFTISPYRPGILLGGVSEGGKSTFGTSIAESLASAGYQFCLIDPEGDYLELPDTVVLGNNITLPLPGEIVELLKNTQQNLVVCLLSIPQADRPVFFSHLFAALLNLRREYGHPHWLLMDEAHHLIPAHVVVPKDILSGGLTNFILISTSPHALNPALLSQVGMVITIGNNKKYVIEQFCVIRKCAVPGKIPDLSVGEASVWDIGGGKDPYMIHYKLPGQLQHRHKRKYAIGDMAENSFIFTGPQNKMHLKANSLMMFVQLAEGIDDDTWLYHLKRNDYKNWAADCIHDQSLVDAVKEAGRRYPDVYGSKKIILGYIKKEYTA